MAVGQDGIQMEYAPKRVVEEQCQITAIVNPQCHLIQVLAR